jgi:hypothetical protein
MDSKMEALGLSNADCACLITEDSQRIKFCRDCATMLPQRLEDGQANPDWLRARLGKLTASCMADALAGGKGVTRTKYRARLITERLSGVPYEGFTSSDTERGIRLEPAAVNAYELFYPGLEPPDVQKTGVWYHPTIENLAASPDRLVDSDGIMEVKIHSTHIHFDMLLSQRIPDKDVLQMLTGLACTKREWCDYVSFDDESPAGCDLFVRRFYRDDHKARIAEIEERGQEFLYEVEKLAKDLQERAEAGFIFLDREPEQNGDGLAAQLTNSLAVVPMKRKRKY